MKKNLLIIGYAPLPHENSNVRSASGLRTYQFLKPIKNDSSIYSDFHLKTVCVCDDENFKNTDDYELLYKNDPKLLSKIQKIHDDFRPDVILAINNFCSFLASKLKSPVPLWTDMNGWWPGESQAQANSINSDDYSSHYRKMQNSILQRADKISTVSLPQKHAVYGELSILNRLNHSTFGYEFAHHIPNGTEIFAGEEKYIKSASNQDKKEFFNLLWLGGYNNWVDENTLFLALEKAFMECPNLQFVSTGGKISGLSNKVFEKFYEKSQNSTYKDRYKYLGWVKTHEIPQIISNSDAGLNVDILCAETIFGARNRINEYMKFGLPVITTNGSEIASEVEKSGSGLVSQSGNPDDLAERIIEMYNLRNENPEKYFGFCENGKKYILTECNFNKLGIEFFEWLKNPLNSPDFGRKNAGSGFIKAGVRYLKDNGLKKFISKLIQKIRGLLHI